MYLKDGAKARNIPCFRWCDQEIVWRSRSQQLKSTNYYMTTTPMSLQRFSLSASALLPSWVKPWPIQTTPASIGSMMMPYGAWTSNVVWSGTVWGTPVNHHLPSKPGNLEQVEAWCVLLSLFFRMFGARTSSLCLVLHCFQSFWLTKGLLPSEVFFPSQGAKFSSEVCQVWRCPQHGLVQQLQNTNRKVEHQVSVISVNSNGWNGKGDREPFCFRFLFAMADTCRMLRPLQQRYEKWPSLVREVANEALSPLRKSSSRRWPRIFILGSFAIYLELESKVLIVTGWCGSKATARQPCSEEGTVLKSPVVKESLRSGPFEVTRFPSFSHTKSAFEDFPSHIEFEDFPHLDRSLRSGELLVAFGRLSRGCHGMGKCQDLQCKVRAIGCSTRGAPKICGFRVPMRHFVS